MAQPTADRQPRLVNNASGSSCVLAVTHVHYLKTVRKLLVEYQRAYGVKQKQVFIKMMHVFMQKLCAYPLTSYIVTTAVCSNTAADNVTVQVAHVMPRSGGLLQPQGDTGGVMVQAAPCTRPGMRQSDRQGHCDAAA